MARTKAQERERKMRSRAEARKTGMCTRCFCRPAEGGLSKCARCRAYQHERESGAGNIAFLCDGAPSCQCPGCPEAAMAFLTIDHIHNDGYKEVTAQSARNGPRKRMANVRDNPERFQVLCYNCNCSKGHSLDGRCPLEGTDHRSGDSPNEAGESCCN